MTRLHICICISCCSITDPANDTCVCARHQLYALVFVHIVFHEEEVVGNSLEKFF